MKFDEALKLANFKEHYSIILGNVNIANSELERVLSEKDGVVDSVRVSKNAIAALEEEISILIDTRNQIILETDSRIKEVNDKERFLLQLKEDAKNFVDNSKIELEKVKSKLQKDIDVLDKELQEGVVQKSVMEKSIGTLSKQVATLSDSSKALAGEVQSLDKKRAKLLKEIEDHSTTHKRTVEADSREIEFIQKQIKESKDKVLDTDNHFAQKEKDIARRENDVLVITKRLRTLFQEVKPGIALKI